MTTPTKTPAAAGEQQLFSATSFPEMYEQALVGALFDPWVALLLDDVALAPGDRLLDVACGTGIAARRARERLGEGATVVGVDVNPGMLGVARRVAPAIDWRQGDAADLPLRDGERFDVVLCQQGFQFFADRAGAAREMRRALVEGGRVGVSTWLADEEFPFLRALREVAERRLGPIDDRRHALGDPRPVEDALAGAGFGDVRTKRYTRTIRFERGEAFLHLNAMALVSMSGSSGGLAEDDRRTLAGEIARDSAELARPHLDGAALIYELGTNVVVARA